MFVRRNPKLAAAMLAFPLLIAVLAGCTSNATSPGGSTTSPSPSASSFEDYDLAFAACMREQGVDVTDPGGSDSSISAGNDPAFLAAIDTCIDELGPAPAPSGENGSMNQQEQHEADLQTASCLRENGIDIPDPKPGEGLTLPMDASRAVLEECLANGIPSGTDSGGN